MTENPPTASVPLKLAVVTNIPAPYRVPVYNRLATEPGIHLHAFYAARSEPDRQWDLPAFAHEHQFLQGRMRERNGRFIHYNPDVWPALRAFGPDVVVTTGFNPTHLIAWLYALTHRKPHVVMTDGTDVSESGLGRMHRLVRRTVFGSSRSFIVASEGGRRLLHSYGVADDHIHASPLCANPVVAWGQAPNGPRDIDLLFSGRMVGIKNGAFALQVAQGVAHRLQRSVQMVLLGNGPEEAALRALAATLAPEVATHFAGHVAQDALPGWFHRARLFLFPTQWDPWGVVANEAGMAGVPVLVSPHAGAANDLVRDGINGRVLPLNLDSWVAAAATLLTDAAELQRMSDAARAIVSHYGFDSAAQGMADAARQAVHSGASSLPRPSPLHR